MLHQQLVYIARKIEQGIFSEHDDIRIPILAGMKEYMEKESLVIWIMDENDQMLTPQQVAEILGVHTKTVHLWLRSGRLPGTKISYRAWRISRKALDSFLANNSNTRITQQTGALKGSHEGTKKQSSSGVDPGEPGNVQMVSEATPQVKMKHYIRDIMGEQAPGE